MIRPVLVAEKSPAVAKVHLKSAQLIGMSCEPICVTGWPVEAMIHLTGRWDKSENSSSPFTQSLFMSRSGPWRLTVKDSNLFQYECHIYIHTYLHTYVPIPYGPGCLANHGCHIGIHIFGSGPLGPVGVEDAPPCLGLFGAFQWLWCFVQLLWPLSSSIMTTTQLPQPWPVTAFGPPDRHWQDLTRLKGCQKFPRGFPQWWWGGHHFLPSGGAHCVWRDCGFCILQLIGWWNRRIVQGWIDVFLQKKSHLSIMVGQDDMAQGTERGQRWLTCIAYA